MKKLVLFCLIFGCFKNAFSSECTTKYSAILLDQKNENILYEKRAKKIIYPASLTKIMTLYLIFEAIENNKLQLDQKVKASKYAEDISNINRITTLHLKEGQEISIRKLIRATAVKSMNGAAVMLAEALAGDEWSFAKMMNKKAKELKMFDSNFRNSTGLHEDGQYSTVYDLARLLVAIQKDFSQYRGVFSRKEIEYKGKKFISHNHFLLEYEGATGFKTGFTSIAGFNLMATAKRNNINLSGVITSCETHQIRDEFSKLMFDHGFKILNSDILKNELTVKL